MTPDFFAPAPQAFPAVVPPPGRSLAAVLVADQVKRDERAARSDPLPHEIAAHIRRAMAAEKAPKPAKAPRPPSIHELQAIADRAFYQDAGFHEGAEVGAEMSDADRAFAFSAEGAYLALCKAKTGETAPDGKLSEWLKAAAKLLAQSEAIAAKMKAAGFDCYRETPFFLYRYFIHSRHLEALPSFRRCTFIPYVAQMLRAPLVAALEAFLETQPFARMWTLSSGPRVPLREVRERVKWLHRRISELNAEDFMKAAGVEICFRSTELGTPEFDQAGNKLAHPGEVERDAAGALMFHVHAHCVVILKKGFIKPKKWTALLERVGAFWVHWWKDGGEDETHGQQSGLIVNPREVCKYVTKPDAMEKLDGAELVALQRQLARLKLVQPMGALADHMQRRGTDWRLVKEKTPDGPVYREVKNWNKRPRRTRNEKHADAAEKLLRREQRDCQVVVSRGLPRIGPSGFAEPVVTVMTTAWNEKLLREVRVVKVLIHATGKAYADALSRPVSGGSAPISVHTCTATVPAAKASRPWNAKRKRCAALAAAGIDR